MLRSVVKSGLPSQILSCTRGARVPTSQRLSGHSVIPQSFHGHFSLRITALGRYSDLSAKKYTMIYRLPYIKVLRGVSRLKLLQTAVTVVILPPVYFLYLQGEVSSFLVSYATGIAGFAGIMLYTASNLIRRVIGMMYLDPSQTTLKVSLLTFWGKRHDVYLPVSDIMTIADTGDNVGEKILKLKRYSSAKTLFFSTYFGHVVDKQGFEKVFGSQTL
ncbi:transmembrane protein 186 isoform X2 [Thalassophryne amazonica]|nr:transmembrane protein 186 isoform X2 [Thalassophryne amazonica]